MNSVLLTSLFAAVALGQASSTVGCPPCNSTNPLPPSQDPFYRLPSGWQSLPNGGIIRQDNDRLGYCNLQCQGVPTNGTFRVLYKTSNSNNDAAAAVVTVLQPPVINVLGPPPNASRLAVYQPAYDAASNDCSPSYEFLRTTSDNPGEPGVEVSFELGLLSNLLEKGYYTAFTDYETFNASFTSGVTSGRAVLDAIVAALASGQPGRVNSTGVSSTAAVAMAGYSGGALATEWAAELQSAYQPGLSSHIVAIAAGGLPANLNATLYASGVNKQAGAVLIPRAAVGLGNSNAGFNASLLGALKPGAPAATFFSARYCTVPPQHNFTDEDVLGTYFASNNTFFSSPAWSNILQRDGIMGLHGKPSSPTYFWQGCTDEIAPEPVAAALVQKYCGANNQGANINFNTYANQDHGGAAIVGLPGALQFVADRFAGISTTPGCTINNQCSTPA